jgi:8-oxo-dGTP diphosphatase
MGLSAKEPGNRSVAGIAVEGACVFIARRLPKGDLGGKWEFPGGKVEAGESDAQALVREYLEEFGIVIRTGPHLGAASFEHNGKAYSLNAYRVFFDSPRFVLNEHSEWRWAALDEIETLNFVDSDRKLLPFLKLNLG